MNRINRITFACSMVGLCVAAPALAQSHIHLTVDTVSGTPGDATIIRAGYQPSEAAYSVDDQTRYVMKAGEVAVFELQDLLPTGSFQGWAAGGPISLSSDFYFATGRLAGGDFRYELAEVAAVSGSPARAAWGQSTAGSFNPTARSWAATRTERSFAVGAGGHAHGQLMAFEESGVYDLSLIAWDANGVYADSEKVIVRVSTGPAFCIVDLNHDGVIDFADYLEFLNLFEAMDPTVDFNQDGVVDFADYLDFLNLYDAGC